jgi:ribosome-associated translation inhibitor RaiA
MAGEATVIVHIRDVENSEELQASVEKRCQHLADEFHEVDRFEINITPDALKIAAHARASGKKTDVAAHASSEDARKAADVALDRLERELRSRHDKRIFAPRREAKRAKASRKTG